MKIEEFLNTLFKWSLNRPYILESRFFGSQSLKKIEDELDLESDVDIIFIISDESENKLFFELSQLSNDLNILIHPLVIVQSEFDFKYKIFEYKNALEKSVLIYSQKKV